MLIALSVWVLATCLLWLAGPLMAWRMVRAIPRIEDRQTHEPDPRPKLSVVIPACNEAETIEPALASLRAQTYPNLEIVLIDDRSTDGTGAIIDRIDAEDPRVVAMHVTELPEGWLGKVHALDQGLRRSTGEWVLFTDADVKFQPDALERAMGAAVEDGIDHLFLFPRVFSKNVAVELMIGAAIRSITISQRPWRALDPDAEESIGGGAFNLVRRAAFERTPGFEWLRLEVADDLGLARLMKQHGGRPGVMIATGLIEVEWYRNLGESFRGMEKNAFAQMARFSLWRGLAIALLGIIVTLGPPAAFVVPVPWLWLAGTAAFAANFATALLMGSRSSIRPLAMALSAPLGDLLMIALLVRASIVGWRRGGLLWRGTHYPSEALRAGARIRF